MKVLVLGASGHIGKSLVNLLAAQPDMVITGASRRAPSQHVGNASFIQLDTLNALSLAVAIEGFDAVVNCVAGNPQTISDGARLLSQAATAARCPRIIHLSTMSVYGPAEGRISEDTPLDTTLGWYGKAKCEAEAHMAEFASSGGQAVVLRPGCVFGPGSSLWVSRIGRWLQAGRLGDLGVAGDGWSNLVHVDDVCRAIAAALHFNMRDNRVSVFNLAAPDSPRWNEYFVDLALALNATPVQRVSSRQLKLDALLAGPPLKIAEIACARLGKSYRLPDPMPPGLARLWAQHIQLEATRAGQMLGLAWTPYCTALKTSVDWFTDTQLPTQSGRGKVYARIEG